MATSNLQNIEPTPKCRYCRGTGRVELATSVVDCLDCSATPKNAPEGGTRAATTASPAPQAAARPTVVPTPTPSAPGSFGPVVQGWLPKISPLTMLAIQLHKLSHEIPSYAKLHWRRYKPRLKDLDGQILFPICTAEGAFATTYAAYITAGDDGEDWYYCLNFNVNDHITEPIYRMILQDAVAKLELNRSRSILNSWPVQPDVN